MFQWIESESDETADDNLQRELTLTNLQLYTILSCALHVSIMSCPEAIMTLKLINITNNLVNRTFISYQFNSFFIYLKAIFILPILILECIAS